MGKIARADFYIYFFLCVRNIQFSFLFWNDLLVQNKRKIKLYEHKKKIYIYNNNNNQPTTNEERRLLMCILFNNYLTINSNRVLWIKNYVYRLYIIYYIYPTCIYVYFIYYFVNFLKGVINFIGAIYIPKDRHDPIADSHTILCILN